MKKLYLILLFILSLSQFPALSQKVAVRSDLLLWGTTTANLSVETVINPKMTIEVQGAYNPWTYGSKQANKKLKQWSLRPELRRWVYEKFDGHFFGIHLLYIRYNAGGVDLPLGIFDQLKENRYQGYGVGAGLSYGYQWYLGPHWNLEASFGFGYSYMNFDQYECRRCGSHISRDHRHYFGPTRIGVSFVYLFKSKNQ